MRLATIEINQQKLFRGFCECTYIHNSWHSCNNMSRITNYNTSIISAVNFWVEVLRAWRSQRPSEVRG